MGPPGLLTPELEQVALRLVRLGVLVLLLGVMVSGPIGLVVTEDVRSAPVFLAMLLVLLGIAWVVARHDWSTAIARGRAHRHAELWALAVLVATGISVVVSIPRPGSWLYFLVIAVYFSILLPRAATARIVVLALVGVVLGEGVAAGSGAPQVLTTALGVAMVAIIGQGTGEMVTRVVRQSERRARMLATIAQSARAVASLDPDEVPRQVADAGMQLGFDVVAVTEVADGTHQPVVERSVLGTVFMEGPIPIGPMIRRALHERQTIVRDDYLRGESPNPHLRAKGVNAVVVAPVVVDGDVAAILVGGRTARELDPIQTEAFTLLGELLARSLANARQFEREREAVATLDELGRLKDDFISNVSHELRTPITVIMGGLQTLDERGVDLPDPVRRRLFRSAVSNAESLQSTLESLLEFARVERGGPGPGGLVPVDVTEVVRGCVDRLDSLLGGHEVRVDTPASAVVRTVAGQLDRVVDNLLLNAVRHTPPGTRVEVTVRPLEAAVRVAVTDDGPGIEPEDLPHLTDRFFRGGESTTRPTRGLGLGLALAQSILVAHGSHLQIDSAPGRGTSFWFDLEADPQR